MTTQARTGLLHHARLVTETWSMVLEGWPIAAASWWSADEGRHCCGRQGCPRTDRHLVDLAVGAEVAVPCDPALESAVLTDSRTASVHWAQHPYAPALVTGYGVEVIEAPAPMAEASITCVMGDGLRPIVAAPEPDRRLFFAQPPETDPIGAPRSLADFGVQRHAAGTWLILPPAELASGHVRWIRPPEVASWKLTPFAAILSALAATAGNPGQEASVVRRGNGHHPPPPPPSSSSV